MNQSTQTDTASLLHSAATQAARSRSSHAAPAVRSGMLWIRRVHLYSGLFMFPWVLLYAASALLFNHSLSFPDRPHRTLMREDFSGTALAQSNDPSADANLVVAALNDRLSARASQANCRLVEPQQARYTRDRISVRARGAGQEHTVVLDLSSSSATVTTLAQSPVQLAPFAMRGLKVPGTLADRVKTGLPAALSRQGLKAEEAGIAIGTDLEFLVNCDGQLWRAAYNVQTGAVTGVPANLPPEFSLRRFLTRLHVTHGFPSRGGWTWVWALAVDAMVVSMLFWALSGLLMWWQIKRLRTLGALVVCLSLLTATVLALGMHQAIGSS